MDITLLLTFGFVGCAGLFLGAALRSHLVAFTGVACLVAFYAHLYLLVVR